MIIIDKTVNNLNNDSTNKSKNNREYMTNSYKRKRYHKKEKDKRLGQKSKEMKWKIKKNTQNMKLSKNQKIIDNDYWGDKMEFSDKWPGITEDKRLRIMTQNLNGVSYYNKFYEWEHTLQNLHDKQVDIAGYTEMNLDLTQSRIKTELIHKAKQMDQNIKIVMSASKQKNKNEVFKMGGTTTVTRGNWSGRIIQSGQDSLGRWSYTKLTGKKDRKIKIITMYRVCKGQQGSGQCTVRMQQELELIRNNRKQEDPREAILKDLENEITKDHANGIQIILMGDFNEDVTNGKRVREFLRKTNMRNVLETKHGDKQPATYDRGRTPLDMIAMSEMIPDDAILQCGMLPFYDGNFSDHRALFCDIDHSYLFTNAHADTTRHIYRRFTTDNVDKTNKYLQQVEQKHEEARILKKKEVLEEDIVNYLKQQNGNKDEIIKKCHKLFEKTTEIMKYSEKKLGRIHYDNGFPSSQTLTNVTKKIFTTKVDIRKENLKDDLDDSKLQQLYQRQKENYKELRQVQKKATEMRIEHLHKLAEKRSKPWNMDKAQAITIIEAAEQSKRIHKKHKHYVKPASDGNIRHLLVPKPVTN